MGDDLLAQAEELERLADNQRQLADAAIRNAEEYERQAAALRAQAKTTGGGS